MEATDALENIDTSDVEGSIADTPEEAADVASALDGAVDDDPGDDATSADDETISVLEFVLGDERYCLDITFIGQIVERGTVTRIPNAPDFVEGVIDLRGDITTVIDPMETRAATAASSSSSTRRGWTTSGASGGRSTDRGSTA